MKTSAAGIDLIKRNEGLRLTAYRDVVGVLTIGWGDTLNVKEGMTITREEAEERLAGRLAREFEPGVSEAIGAAATSQAQFDAMVSLSWNIGLAGFRRSSVLRHHKAGDYQAAADAFRLWNKAGGRVLNGLVRRREEERALYLIGLPDRSKPATVSDVQRRLNELGHSLVVDGIAGPQTNGAILDALRNAGGTLS